MVHGPGVGWEVHGPRRVAWFGRCIVSGGCMVRGVHGLGRGCMV